MADITASKKNIQVEETDFRSAVSESILQKVGGSINHINDRQHGEKMFAINGSYSGFAPEVGIDGLYIIPFDLDLIGVVMWNLVAGSGGTTTLDLHRFTAPNVDAGTIFDEGSSGVRPKIASTAAANSYVGFIGTTSIGGGTGMTAPVLTSAATSLSLDQGDALRIDMDAAMTGSPENCGLVIYFQPR